MLNTPGKRHHPMMLRCRANYVMTTGNPAGMTSMQNAGMLDLQGFQHNKAAFSFLKAACSLVVVAGSMAVITH